MTSPEWIVVTLKVTEALEALQVPYVICGSVASIVHGIVRTTVDCDMVADLNLDHVEPLVTAIGNEFYVEQESIVDAIQFHRSFNLIHQESMFKVDIFIPKARPFDRAQLAHRIELEIANNPKRMAWFSSAENIVLAKLEWFRLGNEVSERQWRDVLGVLKTRLGELDIEYMYTAAPALGVSDLLERALLEAEK